MFVLIPLSLAISQVTQPDLSTPEKTVTELYKVISGGKGVKRDWDRFKSLFKEEGRMMGGAFRADGSTVTRLMTPAEYQRDSGAFIEERGFFEQELTKKVQIFGAMAHVFSTYESKWTKDDPKPFARGINSIQLWFDGKAWKVVSIIWLGEDKNHPIPKEFDAGTGR
ncbi:MAG TPA: hypothetical protein VK171_15100 [Fimbriimonas sp.]|nr:hypothetical protein [Fimbriimonas sp.]